MSRKLSSRTVTVLQALFVTFLWSTSWVFIKIGLEEIPALTFAGLRYTLAFLVLLPVAASSAQFQSLRGLSRGAWLRLIVLGILLYAVTQGAQFLSLFYLPAITTNMLLSFSTVAVAFLGLGLLGERPTAVQWGGLLLYLGGVVIYFYPAALPLEQRLGIVIALVGVAANALAAVLGRHVNRSKDLSPVAVTLVSMGIGAFLLLATGLVTQGLPPLRWTSWAIIAWLAVVNTAFAFTLWNQTLRTLSAMESSILNSMMMVQIPILALIFLGERLTWREGIGLLVAVVGVFVVQVRRRQPVQEPLRFEEHA